MCRMSMFLSTLILAGLLVYRASGFGPVQTHSAVPVDLEIPSAPMPVSADGKLHLVYELHVTNFDGRARDLTLTRLEVVGDERVPLLQLAGQELAAQIGRPGAAKGLPDKRRIAGGMRAIVFLWITIGSPSMVPHRLHHRLLFAIDTVNGEKSVEGADIDVNPGTPVIIGPPLRGGGWMAANGPSNSTANEHRRAVNTVDGRARIAQRFAIDWIKFGENGSLWSGDANKNAAWFGYGGEVLAVANGVVASTNDAVPDNKPDSRDVPMTLETVAGNYVILDLGGGRYAMYAHLKPGSIRVKAGDKVGRGDVIGLVGNSGNSDGPHLHFQICDANSPLGSEGLPFVFESFGKLGIGELKQNGASWKPLPNGRVEQRRGEIPLENVVVNFPD